MSLTGFSTHLAVVTPGVDLLPAVQCACSISYLFLSAYLFFVIPNRVAPGVIMDRDKEQMELAPGPLMRIFTEVPVSNIVTFH